MKFQPRRVGGIRTVHFAHVADLTDPAALSRVLGPNKSVARTKIGPLGYSGATHERLDVALQSGERVALILKNTRPSADWAAVCTGDTLGREAHLLQAPELAEVWHIFANPYIACAAEHDRAAVLMDDLSGHIWADRNEITDPPPLSEDDEDALLRALARLHARFWQSDALRLPWLLQPADRFALLGPLGRWRGHYPTELEEQIRRGWRAVLSRVPEAVRSLLTKAPEVLAARYADLPFTLLHGDTKVSNFAVLPNGEVAAIDWAWVGAGPATLDLGWYLAINGGRLARSRSAVIERYRRLLEAASGAPIGDDLWARLVDVGVLCGALVLLWLKALALEEQPSPELRAEWQWWIDALAHVS
jgi:aminoglycoside phosphotransferase (APT) family kinase protein